MKKIFIIFLSLFSLTNLQAQIHEIGVFLGGSNYIGDIGPTTYINPNEPAIGILYKWNKSPRHSYRISYVQSQISSRDFDSKEASRYERGFNLENDVKELSLGLEFNFFDFNLHEGQPKLTPYVASGLSYFFDSFTLTNDFADVKITGRSRRKKSIAIPMIVGLKATVMPQFILAIEAGARYSQSDNMDGSFNEKFGNINNNDWYVFSGLTLTYTFGKSPCYCAE
ncbi:type IX secretion system protein PorG [Flavobacterium sp. GNP001]